MFAVLFINTTFDTKSTSRTVFAVLFIGLLMDYRLKSGMVDSFKHNQLKKTAKVKRPPSCWKSNISTIWDGFFVFKYQEHGFYLTRVLFFEVLPDILVVLFILKNKNVY